MKHNKYLLLDQLISEVNEQISIVNNHYLKADEDLLKKPAENGGWSIIQCLDHLNSYGNYYLPQIKGALKKAHYDSRQVYYSGWLGDYFTKIMSPDTGTKKHKAFKGHVPALNLNPNEVITDFLRQEHLLLRYLETAKSFDLSIRIPISISKWISLKLGDIFRFVIIHNRRHILQAERNFEVFALNPQAAGLKFEAGTMLSDVRGRQSSQASNLRLRSSIPSAIS